MSETIPALVNEHYRACELQATPLHIARRLPFLCNVAEVLVSQRSSGTKYLCMSHDYLLE